jgi:molecular chaperone DnaK (HSP70)
MNSAFRLKENLYLEVSAQHVYALIPAGRTVPANWQQTFTTSAENQRSFDLHLLRGVSENLTDNATLGKWRIGGIPAAPKGQQRVHIEIRVGIDGSVGLRATLEGKALPVTLLTEAFPKLPLTFRVPTIPFEKLIQEPCPECNRNFVMRSFNWKKQPFALCLDCGHEFSLPETPPTESAPWKDLPPELVKTLGIERPRHPGGLNTGELRELQDKGFDIFPAEEPDLKIDAGKSLQQLSKMMFKQPQTEDLSPEEIVRLAGEPLPEEKRRRCPKCDAVISREIKRCEWCGQVLE